MNCSAGSIVSVAVCGVADAGEFDGGVADGGEFDADVDDAFDPVRSMDERGGD